MVGEYFLLTAVTGSPGAYSVAKLIIHNEYPKYYVWSAQAPTKMR